MTKEFIPYEQALALKELGFDEPCLAHRYSDRNDDFHFLPNPLNNSQLIKENRGWSTPTFSQAFRWFREKFNLYHEIRRQRGVNDSSNVFYVPITCNGGKKENTHTPQSTYEQSELVCLIKLIQILNQKL
jgi:hypothetical protein